MMTYLEAAKLALALHTERTTEPRRAECLADMGMAKHAPGPVEVDVRPGVEITGALLWLAAQGER